MQVVQATRFGGPEVLETVEVPDPIAGPGEVVVEVSVAEVLFLDTQLRSGWGSEYFALEPPYVPGTGVAGEVISVGEGVDPGWVGRRVVAGTARSGEYAGGGYAERATAPAEVTFEVPDRLDLRRAMAALHDGIMALSRMERAGIQPGERVLVNAAGGSLGVWLVPLAKAVGARVIGAARGERKLEQARSLGADVVVDYSETGWAERVREATGGVDVVFDGAGGRIGGDTFEITAHGGRFFSYGAASGDFAEFDRREAERRRITVVGVEDDEITPEEQRRLTGRALSEVAEGRLRPIIGQTFPLERAADAHAAIEARSILGKTLLYNIPSTS